MWEAPGCFLRVYDSSAYLPFLINHTGVVPDEGQWLYPPRPLGLRLMACPGSLCLHVNNGSFAVRKHAQTHLPGCSGALPCRLDEAGGEIKYIDLGGRKGGRKGHNGKRWREECLLQRMKGWFRMHHSANIEKRLQTEQLCRLYFTDRSWFKCNNGISSGEKRKPVALQVLLLGFLTFFCFFVLCVF